MTQKGKPSAFSSPFLPKSSREAYFRYLDAGDCRAHLHLSCSSCGKTFHMSAARTDSLIDSVEGNENFLIDRSNTVLYGLCDKCQTKK